MGHIHAELMKQYAEDAAKSETPWDKWEFNHFVADSEWTICNGNPSWYATSQYRRKPKQKFIELNGKRFEIFAEEPEYNSDYWVVDVVREIGVALYRYNSSFDEDNFHSNNCFKDQKTAQAFAGELKKIFQNVVES